MPASDQPYFLILDAGSGAGRAMIFDQCGQMVSHSYQEWAYHTEPGIPDAVSFDPEMFLDTLLSAAKQAVMQSGINPANIAGLCSTCLREGVIFIDNSGKELYCGANFDGRAAREGKQLEESIGPEIYRKSGTYPPAYGYLARLKWFNAHHPEIYLKIDKVLEMGGWITFRLTGSSFAEPTLASASGVFSIADCSWASNLIQSAGIDPAILPNAFPAGSLAGPILPEMAYIIGIPRNTPVFIGGGDSHCALLGMGCLHPGDTGTIAGTTSPSMQITSRPVIDPDMRTWSSNFLTSEHWILESNAIITGLAYRWLRDCMFPNGSYSEMERELKDTAPGSKGIKAFIGAERMDMKHYIGQWQGGFLFPVPPSDFSRGDFTRAVIESNIYAVRANIYQIESITGVPAKTIHLCGGQTESESIIHMMAGILHQPVMIYKGQRSALGAAMLTAAGSGLVSELEQAVEIMKGEPETVTPNPNISEVYEPLFQDWMQSYEEIKYKKEINNA